MSEPSPASVLRVAAVQLNSQQRFDDNLEQADRLTRAAVADGAKLVLLPEKWNVLGTAEQLRAGDAAGMPFHRGLGVVVDMQGSQADGSGA